MFTGFNIGFLQNTLEFLCFFLNLLFFCSHMKKSSIITDPTVLSSGDINDCITDVCNDFSSYLKVLFTLEPFVFKNFERNLMFAASVVSVYLISLIKLSLFKDWFQFFSSEEEWTSYFALFEFYLPPFFSY